MELISGHSITFTQNSQLSGRGVEYSSSLHVGLCDFYISIIVPLLKGTKYS